MPPLRPGYPLQNSCLENPMDRGAWWAIVDGVARVRHDLETKLPPLGLGLKHMNLGVSLRDTIQPTCEGSPW